MRGKGVIRIKIGLILECDSIIMTQIRGYWMPVKKLEVFDPPSTVWSSGTHFLGGTSRKI